MKGIRKITPYVPGEQPNFPGMVKLNTNENSYPPSPKVSEALTVFNTDRLKLYSSLTNQSLKEALAIELGVDTQQLIIGNGSDEVLAFCFLAFFNSSDPILFPDITYGFYRVWADLFKIPFQEIPLTDTFKIDFSDYSKKNGGIIIANPNAPTGIYKENSEIEQLLQQHPDVIVIIDEAYIDFAEKSSIELLDNYPNLVIVRTFSKSRSLAGLRVGYAIGNPEFIQVVESIKSSFNPYSVDILAENLAAAATKDLNYYQEITTKICTTRDWFSQEISKIGFLSLPSKTNFILTTHPDLNMEELYKFLEKETIFVRYFGSVPRLQNYLRISIGTQTEMEKVSDALKSFKNQQK
ncbi:histidinol-phosphate transaminase [Enterococcus sp. LJL99]